MGCAAVWDVMRAVMTVTIFYNFLPSWFPIRENLQFSCAEPARFHVLINSCNVYMHMWIFAPLIINRPLWGNADPWLPPVGLMLCPKMVWRDVFFCLSPPLWALIAEPLHAYRDDTILEVSEPWCGKSANLMLTSWPVKSEQGISSIQFQVAGLRGFWTPVSKPFRCFQGSVCLARTRQAVWGLAGRRGNR